MWRSRVVACVIATMSCKPAASTSTPEPADTASAPAEVVAPDPSAAPPAMPPKPGAIACGASQCSPPEACLEAPGMDATGPVVIRMCGIRCDPHAAISGCPSEMVCVPVSDGAGPRCVASKR